jgi:hypothetical protein
LEILQVMQAMAEIPRGTVLQLSHAQVQARAQQLKALGHGWFEALETLVFYAGDVLTFGKMPPQPILAAFIPPEMQHLD